MHHSSSIGMVINLVGRVMDLNIYIMGANDWPNGLLQSMHKSNHT